MRTNSTSRRRYSTGRILSAVVFLSVTVLLFLSWKEAIQLVVTQGGDPIQVQSRGHDEPQSLLKEVSQYQEEVSLKLAPLQQQQESWNSTTAATQSEIGGDDSSTTIITANEGSQGLTNDTSSVNEMSARLSTQYQYSRFDVENPSDCILTVLVLDPRVAVFPADGLFYTSTMESVAEYTPVGTCIVFHTSSCRLVEYLQHGVDLSTVNFIDDMTKSKKVGGIVDGAVGYVPPLNNETMSGVVETEDVIRAMARNIYTRAGPQLRSVIEKGRVRLSILRHDVYGLQACDNFYNPKQLFMSARFWVNEFIPKQDSDLVLNIERDVFLCKPLKFTKVVGTQSSETWSKFAFVGAPWRPRVGGGVAQLRAFARHDLERQYPAHTPKYSARLWGDYWNDQEKHYTEHVTMNNHSNTPLCTTLQDRVNQVLCPLPPFPVDLTWPEKYPYRPASFKVGNGGFSLRSRKWMIRAIRACPDLELSGLFPDGLNTTRSNSTLLNSTTCTSTRLFDDVYFSLVIQLIGGLVPTPQQAVQFSGGMVWANDVLKVDGNKSRNDYSIYSVSGDEGVETYWHEMETIGKFLPIGYHKCHYQSYECPERRHCKYSFNDAADDESRR